MTSMPIVTQLQHLGQVPWYRRAFGVHFNFLGNFGQGRTKGLESARTLSAGAPDSVDFNLAWLHGRLAQWLQLCNPEI